MYIEIDPVIDSFRWVALYPKSVTYPFVVVSPYFPIQFLNTDDNSAQVQKRNHHVLLKLE